MTTPEKLGRYEILGELGKGAMGIVYLARDPLIGRQLALKTFRLGYSAGDQELEQFRTRFLREAQSAGILSHPNIVTIHDVAVDPGGDFFIAMEYVQGTDLKLVMQRQGRFEPRFAVEVIAQIADGLGYAHSKGVVHRDIKPANIIITADKQAKITDFGIARVEASNLTVEGQLLGTPNYMAPEQIQGKEVDHRADIFSLGVMFYELLTGKKPFAAQNMTAVTHRIVFEPFPPLEEHVRGLPEAMTAVLDRALAKDPEQRYDKGAEMASDLRAIYASPSATAEIPSATRTGSFLEAAPAAGAPAAATQTPPGGVPVPTQAPSAPAVTGSAAGVPAAGVPVPVDGSTVVAAPAATPAVAATAPQAAGTTGTFTPLPVAAPAPAAVEPPRGGMPVAGRLAVIAGLIFAVALVGAGIYKLTAVDGEVARAPDPELERQQQVQQLLEEGRGLLDAGRPAAALEVFERALVVAPENREVRRWRDQAETAALPPAHAASRLEAAQGALRARDYPTAIRLVEEVLASDPELAEAKDLLAEAREGQRRRQEIRARLRTSSPTTTSNQAATARPAPPAATPAPAAAAAAEALLTVAFVSEVPEGTLKIFAGKTKIYDEDFKLPARKSSPATLREELSVPSGNLDLNIYVRRKGSTTRSHNVRDRFQANSQRTLHIRLLEAGQIRVNLE